MRNFPSYRFHPDGLMALIHCEDDHKNLEVNGWQETLPPGFVVPSAPNFYNIGDIPTTHKCAIDSDIPYLVKAKEPEPEPEPEEDEDEGQEMTINPEVQAAEDAVKAIPKIDRKTMSEDEKRRIRSEKWAARNRRIKIKAAAKKVIE